MGPLKKGGAGTPLQTMGHRFWNMWISQKPKNPGISRTKHFFFKKKNALITHQGLLYGKNSFIAEVTFD